MFNKQRALILLLLAVLAVPTHAGSLSGSTGLFHIPTSDVMPLGVLGASVHVADSRVTAGVGYGLLDFLEVGATVRFSGGTAGRVSPFIKGQIFPETVSDPGLAAGIENGSAYVVMSKTLAPLVRGHAGVGTGRLGGLFAGVSYLVNPVVQSRPDSFQMPRVLVIGEFDGSGLNAGARLSFAQGLDVNIFLNDFNNIVMGASWRTRF